MLEDANKRLIELSAQAIDMQQQQIIVNQALLETLTKLAENSTQAPDMPILPSAGDLLEQYSQLKAYEARLNSVDVSTMSTGQQNEVIYTYERIVESGKEYTRKTHPALFGVVDYLEQHPSARHASVRKIADMVTSDTGQAVGKSWAAIAKNYWQNNKD